MQSAGESPVDPDSHDPELQRLVDRWPTLPEATKAKIIGLADVDGGG